MLAVLVEEEPLVRELSAAVLRRSGMHCLDFASTDDALPAIAGSHGRIAVLVTEVEVPGDIDGLGLARRASQSQPGIPIVVMSGSSEALLRATAMPEVTATLYKPFPAAELVRIAHLVAGADPAREDGGGDPAR